MPYVTTAEEYGLMNRHYSTGGDGGEEEGRSSPLSPLMRPRSRSLRYIAYNYMGLFLYAETS